MNTRNIKSIQLKITLWAGCCLLLASAVIITYAALSLRDTAIKAAEEQAVAMAEAKANRIDAEIEVVLDATRTLAQALSAVKDKDTPVNLSREEANAMLKQVLVDNPQFLGVYTLWEPNAFDGLDTQYVNQETHDQTGRFIPYWNKNKQGEIHVEALADYENEATDWYWVPKKTGKECIFDLIYPVQGEDTLMISPIVPVMANGQFQGIVGVDMRAEFLQQLADDADILGGVGKMVLISYDGTILSATGQPELLGKYATELHPDFETDNELTRIQKGEQIVEYQGDQLEVFVPIRFGWTDTPWSLNILIPTQHITAEATTLMWRLAAMGVLLTGVTLVLLWMVAGQIAKPIRQITAVARTIASGNLEVEAQGNASDETGTLAKTFNQMTASLRRMIEAEQHTVVEYVAFADRVRTGDLTGQLQLNGNADDPLTRLGQNINRLVADLRQRVSTEQEARAHLEQTVDHYLGFVERVADGDLTARLSLNGRQDALTILGQNLNSMVERLSEMTSQIREATANIAAAAAEILAATTQQASGANEQSAAIAQTSTTIDEVKLIVEQAFAKAQSVAEQAQRTQAVSQAGQHAVKETVGSMRQIKDKVEGIAENILSLSEQTQQIGNIITTVNDIAAQSNLLALNASVEAARAGEHGRGFAVVAVEVRNLAEQSRQATAQVKALLNEIQRATNAAVMATEEGVKGVDSGVVQTGQAGETIEQLAAGIAANASAAQQIVASAQQQTTGIEQLALAMQSINQATVQSLASTRQAEKAARDLSALAEQMESLVGRYRLVI